MNVCYVLISRLLIISIICYLVMGHTAITTFVILVILVILVADPPVLF